MNVKLEKFPDTSAFSKALASALVEAGQGAIVQIQRRAASGIGLSDNEMPKYSEAYARKKAKAGKSATSRTLSESGRMLGSIHIESVQVESSQASVTIGFSDPKKAEIAAYNQAISPWFGLSPKDREVIMSILEKRAASALKAQQ